jgi:hypothetical protein
VHGRPKETIENVSASDDPLDVASMSREQRDALKRQILRQHPELAEQYTGSERSSSPRGIFLFDETDALFEKRGEVRDGHDRYANMKVNYLLPHEVPARSIGQPEAGTPIPREELAQRGTPDPRAHSGQTRLDSAKGAQRSAEVRRAKAEARRETLRDRLARKLEERADEVVAAYLAGSDRVIRTVRTGLRTPGSQGCMAGRRRRSRMSPSPMILSTLRR